MRQVIWSPLSGTTALAKPWSSRPAGSALTMLAAQPSAKIRNDSTLSQIAGLLQMQGAQLEIDHQHPRLGLRADDVAGELEPGQGRLAAHEADHGALDARPQPEPLDDLQVEARRVEAGAGGDDQMGDRLAPRRSAQAQHRRLRQREGMLGEEAHARRRVGERAAGEQADAVQFARRGVRLDERIAVLDLRPVGHAPEQPPRALVGQELRRIGHELVVDVELRHGRGDVVEMGHGHVGVLVRRGVRRPVSSPASRAPREAMK